MKRRDFMQVLMPVSLATIAVPALAKNSIDTSAIAENAVLAKNSLPPNIQQMIRNVLSEDYKKVNSDWSGTIKMEGLLRLTKKGFSEGYNYVNDWFNYRMQHDKLLTDEEFNKQYDGNKARIMREGPLTFSIYSAMLGVAFPVHELYKINKDKQAKRVCMDVADAILHYASRDKFGMLAHDDANFEAYAIPDTAYWATRASSIAASLSKNQEVANIYWKQAIFQLSQGIKYFFDNELGIVRTGLFKSQPSQTYWCRSQGWLMWATTGLLRYLPTGHPRFKEFAEALKKMADGVNKFQSKNGALHVLVNDSSSPEEVTSISMVVAAIKEAMRNNWIPNDYNEFCERGWKFIQQSVDINGKVTNAYTGWAVPAENKQVDLMDKKVYGYVPGIIMVAADEMTN